MDHDREVTTRWKDPDLLRHIVLDFKQMSEFVKDPLVIEHADGVRYWDVDGKCYLDGLSGVFVVNLGHNNRGIIEAIRAQQERISFAPPLHATSPVAVELAARIAEVAPGDLNTVKLLDSGSEATEAAMKLARQYHRQSGHPGKYKIISRYHGYHGATFGALAATGATRRRWQFEPFPPGFIHVQTAHCYRCPYRLTYPACDVLCARIVRDVIEMEGPETVAAFIVEPIGNTGGIITPPDEYFPILREICDEFNVLLIFDEMITGFGRTGRMWGADTFSVVPDIICMGKGITGGYAPLSAIAFSDKIESAFWGPGDAGIEFSHGHTYAGNPISAAAGLEAIRQVVELDLPGRARELGAFLQQRLLELSRFGIVGEVRGKGLLLGVELVKDPNTKEPFSKETRVGTQIGQEALRRGLIIRFDPDWFALAPPLVVTKNEIDEMMEILDDSIGTVLERL